MLETVSVILVNHKRQYLLQYRDDIPTIADPDSYSTWGGSIEVSDVSPRAAAIRELKEELSDLFDESKLIDLGSDIVEARTPQNRGQQIKVHFFALKVSDNLHFTIREGRGLVAVTRSRIYRDPKVSDIARWCVERYEAAA